MHIDIIFNISISIPWLTQSMRNYQNSFNLDVILETWMSFAVLPLGATADAKDYLRNFNLLEAKVNPARHSCRVYNHAVHKQVYKLT